MEIIEQINDYLSDNNLYLSDKEIQEVEREVKSCFCASCQETLELAIINKTTSIESLKDQIIDKDNQIIELTERSAMFEKNEEDITKRFEDYKDEHFREIDELSDIIHNLEYYLQDAGLDDDFIEDIRKGKI